MNTLNPRPGAYANQRRSQRILLTVPVMVSGVSANGAPFSERTSTRVVNAHGALVQLRERVLLGQALRAKHLMTTEELDCNVVDINKGNSGVTEVGVEFLEACPHFWRVSFPPPDWNPRSLEAKRYAGEPAVENVSSVKK